MSQTESGSTPRDAVPYKKILGLWKDKCPHLEQPVRLTANRKKNIRARWYDELPDLQAWEECFGYVAESRFLAGDNARGWEATLDWVVKPDNLAKLYERKYDNAKNKTRGR